MRFNRDRQRCSHGYRLEAGIVIWSAENVLNVPANALFRENGLWYVFRVNDGFADQVQVELGVSNGIKTEVTSGLAEKDEVVLYPSAAISDGTRIVQRNSD